MADPLVKLGREQAILLVIDLQEKLLPAIHQADACVAAAGRLIRGCQALGVPVIATEQYPAGLGPTCQNVRELLGTEAPIEKLLFSAYVQGVRDAIAARAGASSRAQVIVTGTEAHVCVQQTVLDLLRDGKDVWVCADAVSSRRPFDCEIALQRMRQAGAVITTTESVLFELLGQAGTDDFKRILKIVK